MITAGLLCGLAICAMVAAVNGFYFAMDTEQLRKEFGSDVSSTFARCVAFALFAMSTAGTVGTILALTTP